jgi:hypothetical protein
LVDAKGLIEKIYRIMTCYGREGCITDEVESHLPHIVPGSVTPRFRQMLDRGMIELTGETRPGNTGRQQQVRRVLPPPFMKPERSPTAKETIAELRARVEELEAQIEETRCLRCGY